ncbi:MAG: glutamine-hydrolyzing carbamoyl-phosphate synthase small subunit [Candidatus Goldiibacteriota bacterium]
MKKAMLMLEDGACFEGVSAGYSGEAYGEIVFNTSMTGYQEIITDPSYKGQIVAMTYTEIGNCGVNRYDSESNRPQAEGFVVKNMSKIASNWRSEMSFIDYLIKNKIPAIEGIDTRKLVRHIRNNGAMKSVLSAKDTDKKSLLKKVKASEPLEGRDLAKGVSVKKEYRWPEAKGLKVLDIMRNEKDYLKMWKNKDKFHVVAVDCGIKHTILRILTELNCKITVVPITAKAERIMELKPDGIFISNGPGDPAAVPYLVEEIKKLLGKKPMFGICFGSQLMSLALGGRTYKLKFGHRGANHPVRDNKTGRIDITVQNHGFATDMDSLKGSPHKVEVTHTNLNDGTVEGIEVKKLKCFAIQNHPEASAGPHDHKNIFDRFADYMRQEKKARKTAGHSPGKTAKKKKN